MTRSELPSLFLVLLLALVLRGGMAVWKSYELTEDRDAYLGIASSVAEGRGYSSPETTQPTAYRPPLYPLLLAMGPQAWIAFWVAALNTLAGTGTVALTWLFGRRLGLSDWESAAAAALVALDPLLVRYASQPMTESVCTWLVTAWLWQTLRLLSTPSLGHAAAAGLLFGLAALCRPTVWVAGTLVAGSVLWLWWRGRLPLELPDPRPCMDDGGNSPHDSTVLRVPRFYGLIVVAAILACVVVVLPWAVRNYLQFGRPILTTTHGGYTLLLGNNDVFFHEVARQPWGTTWETTSGVNQAMWWLWEERHMRADGAMTELAADAWMKRRAWEHIKRDPFGFAAACIVRQYWFWNIVPMGDARTGWPRGLVWCVGGFYGVLWLACLAGLYDLVARRAIAWIPGGLTIVAFAAVHLVYWSNARMRAPLVPILALLAVSGAGAVVRRFRRRTPAACPGEVSGLEP